MSVSGPLELQSSGAALAELTSIVQQASGAASGGIPGSISGGPSAALASNLQSVAATILPSLTEMAAAVTAPSGPFDVLGGTSGPFDVLGATSGPMPVSMVTSGPSNSNIQAILNGKKEIDAVQDGIDKVIAVSQILESEGHVDVIYNIILKSAQNKLARQRALLKKLKELNA